MYKLLIFLPLTVGACNCTSPTVSSRKIVTISTETIYQADDSGGTAVRGATDSYHYGRVRAIQNIKDGDIPSQNTPDSESSGEGEEAIGSEGCTSYAYVKSYTHIESSSKVGNHTSNEEAVSEETKTICLY